MLLGVIPMICFYILSDFLRKLQKGKTGQTLAPTPHRREPTPRRSLRPQRGMSSPK